jgi:hypothetical protein
MAETGDPKMRKLMTFLAIAAVAADLAAPVYAADTLGGGPFNATTVLGWRQTNRAAAMAYFHMPFAGGTHASVPHIGLMVAGPSAYYPGESALHLDGPRVLDLSFGRGAAGRSWSQTPWSTTLMAGNAVAWSNDHSANAPTGPRLAASATTWVAVGLLTAGAVVGAFALANRKQPGS